MLAPEVVEQAVFLRSPVRAVRAREGTLSGVRAYVRGQVASGAEHLPADVACESRIRSFPLESWVCPRELGGMALQEKGTTL